MRGSKWDELLPKIVSNPNWVGAWFLSGLISLIWLGIAYFIPDHWFKPVAVIVTLLQNVIIYVIRAGKYVLDRTLEIPDGSVITPIPVPDKTPPV